MTTIPRFSFAREPRLEFGAGQLSVLPRCLSDQAAVNGRPFALVAVVTGSASFKSGPRGKALLDSLRSSGFPVAEFAVSGEPSPRFVDDSVRAIIDAAGPAASDVAVVGIGGGSAMDAGKAVAAMIPTAAAARAAGKETPSVKEYLEGVGTLTPQGKTAFYIAVPTTAGTGTEASKNAVISSVGEDGFKKSLRHDAYAPAVAVIDPELALGCPFPVSAASGLDAFTQLLESYVSPSASPMVEALCESGIERFASAFPAMLDDLSDLGARTGMAYAAYLSGIGLANAGLGSVHGLASPLGGRFEVPHGLVCGLLVLPAVRQNARLLAAAGGNGKTALAKYARAGYLLAGEVEHGSAGDARVSRGLELLESTLEKLVSRAALPRLGFFGMKAEHIEDLAARASAKTNPIAVGKAEYAELLRSVL